VQEFLRTYKVRRVGRVIEYLCLALSGVILTIFPSDLVSEAMSKPANIFWSASLAITGISCLWGSLTDRWLGEYAGLPLLGSSIAAYAASALLGTSGLHGKGFWILIAFGLLLMAFSASLYARWRDVQAIKGYAERHPDEHYRGGPRRS
jgi:hypothetical protein